MPHSKQTFERYIFVRHKARSEAAQPADYIKAAYVWQSIFLLVVKQPVYNSHSRPFRYELPLFPSLVSIVCGANLTFRGMSQLFSKQEQSEQKIFKLLFLNNKYKQEFANDLRARRWQFFVCTYYAKKMPKLLCTFSREHSTIKK